VGLYSNPNIEKHLLAGMIDRGQKSTNLLKELRKTGNRMKGGQYGKIT